MSLKIIMTGRIDERESAFPQAVQLPDGDILCSFSVGGGQYVHGGTDWARSTDGGCTWHVEGQLLPGSVDSPFRDPAGQLGFWEQKFAEIVPGTIMAVAWTVTLGDYRDQCNSFCFSHNDGETWEPYHSTGIRGQTLSVLPFGNDRLLVLYNRRYGRQGVVMARVKFTETEWTVVEEDLLYDVCGIRWTRLAVTW